MKAEGFADLHQHVLWGVDDGPADVQQMRALLRQDAQQGISLVCATAHADPRNRPFDLARYRERLAEANAFCEASGLPLKVLPGSEIRWCDSVCDALDAGRLLTLGETRYVLIEFAPWAALDEITGATDRLYRAGYAPVLAHVERYRALARHPGRALNARDEYGLIFQVNCDTVLQPRGLWQRRFVNRLLQARAVDALATDAHDTVRRPARMRKARQAVAEICDESYAQTLTQFGWKITCQERKNAL